MYVHVTSHQFQHSQPTVLNQSPVTGHGLSIASKLYLILSYSWSPVTVLCIINQLYIITFSHWLNHNLPTVPNNQLPVNDLRTQCSLSSVPVWSLDIGWSIIYQVRNNIIVFAKSPVTFATTYHQRCRGEPVKRIFVTVKSPFDASNILFQIQYCYSFSYALQKNYFF